jgi:hypothetical protein
MNSSIGIISRLTRAAVFAAGPHTYTVIVLNNLLTKRWFSFGYVCFASYNAGVLGMYGLHIILVRSRKGVENKLPPGIVNFAATVTNTAYLAIVTVLISHLTAMRELFLICFILVTIRIQQTLGGSSITTFFSGPILVFVFGILSGMSIYTHTYNTGVAFDIFRLVGDDNRSVGQYQESMVAFACFLSGAAAQAQLSWITLHGYQRCAGGVTIQQLALANVFVHTCFSMLFGILSLYTPIFMDIATMTINNRMQEWMPRLVLSMVVLLLSTAPIHDSSVLHTILGDGVVITSVATVTHAYPLTSTLVVIVSSAVLSIMAFTGLYLYRKHG